MQGVPARLALTLCAAALALGGCGDSDEAGGDGRLERPTSLPPDFNLQLFNCSDWNRADEDVKRFVVQRLGDVIGDQITGRGANGRGSTLSDEQAHELFNSNCGAPQARGFVLYKLYAHAAGFGGS